MQIPNGQLERIVESMQAVLDDCNRVSCQDNEDLPQLPRAIGQLVDVMTRLDADSSAGSCPAVADISEIGEYALRLADTLATCAERAQLRDSRRTLAGLHVDIALWIARHDGIINTLEPVVDAVALLANGTRDAHELEALSDVISRIVTVVSPLVRQDLEKNNPGRPWRVLLLNQSIVATRSHNTALMEQAFGVLTSQLPEEAGRFFTEGMQQMDALDYPDHVRRVMQKYHRQWTLDRSLH